VRGRGRQTTWDGAATVEGNRIVSARALNFWNPDSPLHRDGERLHWRAVTTGNFGGFDVVLDAATEGRLSVTTALASFDVAVSEITDQPLVRTAGGIGRRLSVVRLPEEMSVRRVDLERRVELDATRDSPLWVCVVQEDGFVAWSSPIYLIR